MLENPTGDVNRIQTLIDLVLLLPTERCDPMNDQQSEQFTEQRIKPVIIQLRKLHQQDPLEIEKVCNGNSHLVAVAKMLRRNKRCQAPLINMFMLMMCSVKMMEFLTKINVPINLFMCLTSSFCAKDMYWPSIKEEGLKFVSEYLKLNPKNFPRHFANLINVLLEELVVKEVEQFEFDRTLTDIETTSEYQENELRCFILDISIDLLNKNFLLAAESSVLNTLYKKILNGAVADDQIFHFAETVADLCATQSSRSVVLNCIDLCKCFAIFINVDKSEKHSTASFLRRFRKSSKLLEVWLSSWPTICFFLSEQSTLSYFVRAIPNRNEKELEIIDGLLLKIMDPVLRYQPARSTNVPHSSIRLCHNLISSQLTLLHYLFVKGGLLEMLQRLNKRSETLRLMTRIYIQYFPDLMGQQKAQQGLPKSLKIAEPISSSNQASSVYSPQIEQLKSFLQDSLVLPSIGKKQIVVHLTQISNDSTLMAELSLESRQQVYSNLRNAIEEKDSHTVKLSTLLSFFELIVCISPKIPWNSHYLWLGKYSRKVLQHLLHSREDTIREKCLQCLLALCECLPEDFCTKLCVIFLDGLGRHFRNHSKCLAIIRKLHRDSRYAFIVSRLLLKISDDQEDSNSSEMGDIIKEIFDSGSKLLILHILETLKHAATDSLGRKARLWSQSCIESVGLLLTHASQEIAMSAVELCSYFGEAVAERLTTTGLNLIKNRQIRKRIFYVLMSSSHGLKMVEVCEPDFIKDELEQWTRKGRNLTRDYYSMIQRQIKKFNFHSKEQVSLDLGLDPEERLKLIDLPWHVSVNEQLCPLIARYFPLKNTLALHNVVSVPVHDQLRIDYLGVGSMYFDVSKGAFKALETPACLVIRREEILRIFQRNKIKSQREKDSQLIKKDNFTLLFRLNNEVVELIKVHLNIQVHRKQSSFVNYPSNLIDLLVRTKEGTSFLQQQKFVNYCEIATKEDSEDYSPLLDKGALSVLCVVTSSQYLTIDERIHLINLFREKRSLTQDYEIIEICCWGLTVLAVRDDLRSKIKESKAWNVVKMSSNRCVCLPVIVKQPWRPDIGFDRAGNFNKSLQQLTNEPFLEKVVFFLRDPYRNQQSLDELGRYLLEELEKNKEGATFSKIFQQGLQYYAHMNASIQRIHNFISLFEAFLENIPNEPMTSSAIHLP